MSSMVIQPRDFIILQLHETNNHLFSPRFHAFTFVIVTYLKKFQGEEEMRIMMTRSTTMLFVCTILVFLVIFQFSFNRDQRTVYTVTQFKTLVQDDAGYVNLNGCKVALWNRVNTSKVPNQYENDALMKRGVSKEDNLRANLSLLGAYAFPDYMAVTITSQNLYAKKVYCRYFDCQHRELLPAYESVVFPESTVYCLRRAGAEFVSLTHELDQEPQYPIPVMNRAMKEPIHNFSVCMAPLYGDEPKWLQIVEFVEHYKLQGATMVYVYVADVDPYSRIILDDYVRTGDIELIIMHDRYEKPDWLFHMVEILDCHQRAKFHSRWVAFVDVDERMHMTDWKTKISDYLQTVTDPTIASIKWQLRWIQKSGETPDRYYNESHLLSEMVFLKYRMTSGIGAPGHSVKCINRPERIAAGFIHYPAAIYKGYRLVDMKPDMGIIRHYRNVHIRRFGGDWVSGLGKKYGGYSETRYGGDFEKLMIDAVMKRTKFVYDTVKLDCHSINRRVWGGHGLRNPCDVEREKLAAEAKNKTG